MNQNNNYYNFHYPNSDHYKNNYEDYIPKKKNYHHQRNDNINISRGKPNYINKRGRGARKYY